jgi:hypothetical protein
VKKCKGSSSALLGGDNPLRIPAVECSGHGDCVRSTGLECREGDACTALCVCLDGYGGADCGLTTSELQAARAVRATYVNAMVSMTSATSSAVCEGVCMSEPRLLATCDPRTPPPAPSPIPPTLRRQFCHFLVQMSAWAAVSDADASSETVALQASSLALVTADNPDQLDPGTKASALRFALQLATQVDPAAPAGVKNLLSAVGALTQACVEDAGVAGAGVTSAQELRRAVHEWLSEEGGRAPQPRSLSRWATRAGADGGSDASVGLEGSHDAMLGFVRALVMDQEAQLSSTAQAALAATQAARTAVARVAAAVLADATPGEPPAIFTVPAFTLSAARSVGGQPEAMSAGLGTLLATHAAADIRGVVDSHVISWSFNPLAWATSNASLASAVTTVELVDVNGTSVAPSMAPQAPSLVPLIVSPAVDTSTFHCGYWDTSSNQWSTSGVVVVGFVALEDGSQSALCASLHLTDFAGLSQSVVASSGGPAARFSDAGRVGGTLLAAAEGSNLRTTLVVLGVVLVFLVAWKVSSKVDERVSEELQALHHVHIMMFGQVRTGFGMDVLHLAASHPSRLAYDAMRASLQVAYLLTSLYLAPRPLILPLPTAATRTHTQRATCWFSFPMCPHAPHPTSPHPPPRTRHSLHPMLPPSRSPASVGKPSWLCTSCSCCGGTDFAGTMCGCRPWLPLLMLSWK